LNPSFDDYEDVEDVNDVDESIFVYTKKVTGEIVHIPKNKVESFIENVQIDTETIGQYTGLCDKNGKKIFEGDIFKPFDNEIIVVAWIDYYSTLGFLCRVEHTETKRGKEITESYDGWAMLCDYELSNLEIIGNIHDNPELLRKEDEGK